MLAILVEQKIINQVRDGRVQDFIGEFNYLGTLYQSASDTKRDRWGNWVPQDPSAAQLRQNLTEYAVLPLGSAFVQARLAGKTMSSSSSSSSSSSNPPIRSILLYGPKMSGKTMMVKAVAHSTGSLVFNLSPSNLVGKFTGKTGPTKLIHMVFAIARDPDMQPCIIYIDECEQVFQGSSGASAGGKKSKKKAVGDGPSRIRSDLMTYLASLLPEDRVLVFGTTSNVKESNAKDFRVSFDKHLYFPYPDYPSRVLLWKKSIAKTLAEQRGQLRLLRRATLSTTEREKELEGKEEGEEDAGEEGLGHLDISTLAHVSEGYASGSITKAVEETLTQRRVERLASQALKEHEFLSHLARFPATYAEDNDIFKDFTAELTGLKEVRDKLRKAASEDTASTAAADGKDDKKKGKGKGKK